ncbi:hypothetical protein B0H66DRAFT_19057 [Apodospora peruviana]|uniref:Tat pathway signal sequence n=1 Tax=Apodospora peruviana TaxID=516989 RepID=A0AAE0IQP2_9PEZI|nr:hypothetical protein B0H66DRAFT_19057 [Apodospora peruviana]
MAPGSSRSNKTPSLRRLSHPILPMPMIVEDDADPPVLPKKSPRRVSRPPSTTMILSQYYMDQFQRGDFTSYSGSSGPPPYSGGSSESGTASDQLKPVRRRQEDVTRRDRIMDHRNEWIARRGGWYRLTLLSILVVGLVVGLSVGLTVGLRKRNQQTPPEPLPIHLFPAGSYAFTTALANMSTGCLGASTSGDWRCFPYTTYTPSSPSTAAATFYWIIEPVTAWSYVISSSDNPFAPSFTNLSLTLFDGNQDTERFTFDFVMAKGVAVTVTDSSSDGSDRKRRDEASSSPTTCWFNSTRVSTTIWTRTRASYPANITSVPAPVNASSVFAPWPYKVDIQQIQDGGGQQQQQQPDCRDAQGRPVSSAVEVVRPRNDDDDKCGCWYANYGLPGEDDGADSGKPSAASAAVSREATPGKGGLGGSPG